MQYKILALDIDFTLLNSKKEITPRVRKALYDARDKGVTVALVTGRMYRAMLPVVEDLGMMDIPCIGCGGAEIWQNGEQIYSRPVPSEVGKQFLDWCAERGVHTQIYIWDDYCFENNNKYAEEYAETFGFAGIQIPEMRRFRRIDSNKILAMMEAEDVLGFIDEAKAEFGDKLAISRSRARYVEINNPEGTKATALDWLVKRQGLTAANTIAMGDATVDLPMIEYAGLGVAMENADEITKSRADLICSSCDEDGVAAVVEKYILGAE